MEAEGDRSAPAMEKMPKRGIRIFGDSVQEVKTDDERRKRRRESGGKERRHA